MLLINIFKMNYLIFLLKLHNNLYEEITHVASKLNNNINPKHDIINYHLFFYKNIRNDSIILDIGCGLGILSYKIAEKAKIVIGIDTNFEKIRMARKKYGKENIKYIHGDAITYNFTQRFDYIILSNVLEHLKERVSFLNKISTLTDTLLIRVPMIDRSWLSVYKKKIGTEYRLDPSHQIEYTFESFKNEIEEAGLGIKSFSIQYGEIWAVIKVN